MDPESPQANPDIAAAWVAGWARSREVAPPTPFAGGHYVEVGLPQHRSRYVFPMLDESLLRRLTADIAEPWTFLKVFSPTPRLDRDWPAPWAVQPHGFMMTAAFCSPDQPALSAGYGLSVEGDSVIGATIYDAAGDVAASGKAALANGHAVFDQIVTAESHRRRGLGRVVMETLAAAACAREVYRGVLVATPDGRALYATLGWRFQAFLTTAVIARPEA